MTVEEVQAAVEEADRLGDALLLGYHPSEIFKHETLAEAKSHYGRHPDSHDCKMTLLWRTITQNRYYAQFMFDEKTRNDLHNAIGELSASGIVAEKYWPGIGVHLFTGIPAELDPKELEDLQEAFLAWSVVRQEEILVALPDDANPEAMVKTFLWEGFLTGMMFAQGIGSTDA